MADLKITFHKNLRGVTQVKGNTDDSGRGFQELMEEAMGKITQVQRDAETAVKELVSGGDITQAVIAMEKAEGNVSQAAANLGISRPTLYQLLTRYGLKKTKSDDQKEKA